VPALPAGSSALPASEADQLVRPGHEWRIEVLSLGAQPREILRYAPEAGAGPWLVVNIDVKQTLIQGAATQAAEIPNPVLEAVLRAEVGDDDDKDDDIKQLLLHIVELTPHARDEAEEQVAVQMKPALKATVGQTIKVRFRERDAFIEVTPGTMPVEALQLVETIQDAVREMLLPLPEQAVGLGAVWRVMTRVQRAAVDRIRVASYRITAIGPSEVALEVEIRERAIASDPKTEALPDDVVLEIRSGEATAKFRILRPRGKLLPSTVTGKLEETLEMNTTPPPGVKPSDKPYRLRVHSQQQLRIRPAKPGEGRGRGG
jgi:hypothetical protein